MSDAAGGNTEIGRGDSSGEFLPEAGSDRAPGTVARIGVELYGVPRLRAGTGRLEVVGQTVGEALAELVRQCPALAQGIVETERGRGWVHRAYRLSLNGDRFISDPATPLNDGDTLLLLTADVGG